MPPLHIVALSLLLVPLGQAEETPRHLGPITGIVIGGDHIYSVSQAGVFREAKRLAKPRFRVMSMAGAPKKNAEPILLLGGGQPASSGENAAIDPANGTLARRKLRDDLVYSVAVSPDGRWSGADV